MKPLDGFDVTGLLRRHRAGEREALDALMPAVYDELRAIAGRCFKARGPDTLQPTMLVQELYLELVDQSRVDWKDRLHFFAFCSRVMRNLLVDESRRRKAMKRGGDRQRVTLDQAVARAAGLNDDLEVIHEALGELAAQDAVSAQVVELRYFGGLNMDEIAELIEMPKRSVERLWTAARAWLGAAIADRRE
ncbi:MAG: sigma-70 family RNA polymerase sigma factor [Planctomycetes bacterium]|nr:sigma-70 family RNA polymerase sigma factor [Planctomycetota bacterium]